MSIAQTDTEVTYNPSSILSIFKNTLNNETTKQLLKVKGVYTQGKRISSNGFYCDNLRDEVTDASITLVVPGIIRSQLIQNQIIEFYGYVSREMWPGAAQTDLQLNFMELLSKSSTNYAETQLKSFKILEKKAAIGFKDVDSLIRSKIINGETISINIIEGKTAINEHHIKQQLQDATDRYKIYFRKINLSSVKEVIENLNYYNGKTDILAIAGGDGESLEILDYPELLEVALHLSTPFVTVLGHAENCPLVQNIADKRFSTPTALVHYLNNLYNNTIADLQNLKAKLVADITMHLEAVYLKQIENLNDNILSIEKTRQSEVAVLTVQLQAAKEEATAFNNQLQDFQKQVEKAKALSITTILLIIAALIIGLVIGKFFM